MDIQVRKFERHKAIENIGRQVLRLVTPNLNPLCTVLIERMSGVKAHKNKLHLKRERIAEEAIAAAARLMEPDEHELSLRKQSYFQRIEKL